MSFSLRGLFEKGKHNIESMIYRMDDEKTIPDLSGFKVTKELGGYNKAVMLTGSRKIAEEAGLKLITIEGDAPKDAAMDLFWKGQTRKANLKECGGSTLLHDLTGGLVPRAEPAQYKGRFGLAQDLMQLLDDDFFSKVKTRKIDFSVLSADQHVQLLTHIIGDRLIDNWDTHQKQYAIDKNNDLISFDKGHGFTRFNPINMQLKLSNVRGDTFNRSLMLGEIHWEKEDAMNKGDWYYINCHFARQIMAGIIKIDPTHPILEAFFDRCEKLSKERVVELYGAYFRGRNPVIYVEILNMIYTRIQQVRHAVYQYFGWVPKDGSPLKMDIWVPMDEKVRHKLIEEELNL